MLDSRRFICMGPVACGVRLWFAKEFRRCTPVAAGCGSVRPAPALRCKTAHRIEHAELLEATTSHETLVDEYRGVDIVSPPLPTNRVSNLRDTPRSGGAGLTLSEDAQSNDHVIVVVRVRCRGIRISPVLRTSSGCEAVQEVIDGISDVGVR